MRQPGPASKQLAARAGLIVAFFCFSSAVGAQTTPVERTFQESKSAIEKALKQLHPSLSGHLPTLEGFAQSGEHPLSRYRRGFYQCKLQVSALPAGGSVVRISATLTAWYGDANASQSGYQSLKSNGRIETDLLEQLADQLSSNSANVDERATTSNGQVASTPASKPLRADEPLISAPLPGAANAGTFSSSLGQGLVGSISPPSGHDSTSSPKTLSEVSVEISSLEEALKHQAQPQNLVAVKKSGTPVVGSPSLTAKTLFLASAQDEFEMLDYSGDWVHVRISGLSRGWIWRTSLEMPAGISDVPLSVPSPPPAADLFLVSREEMAQFPGDWEPLRGRNVRIISVQKVHDDEPGSGGSAKLAFAKSLLDKNYEGLVKSPDLAGMVLIFDSADGGMIAATLPTIQRWKAGKLNDAALWHQCYFDPPETFTISSASGSR